MRGQTLSEANAIALSPRQHSITTAVYVCHVDDYAKNLLAFV